MFFVTSFSFLFLLHTWNQTFFVFCTGKFSSAAPTYPSHDTKECCKYDKDGKAVAVSGKKPYEKKPYKKHGGKDDKQMAYLMDTIESLVKKGLKKAVKKKHQKCSCDSSSSDSNSE
jgi:hypothetical protein